MYNDVMILLNSTVNDFLKNENEFHVQLKNWHTCFRLLFKQNTSRVPKALPVSKHHVKVFSYLSSFFLILPWVSKKIIDSL